MTHLSRALILMLATASAVQFSMRASLAQSDAAATQPAAAAASTGMPVKKVVLFSTGVGFFEHDATVENNAAVDLRFETAQINDVLKSLVVFDHDGGAIKNITYPAIDPLRKTLQSFQVDLSGNPPLADILNQMRGAPVEVSLVDAVVKGSVLGVESKDRVVGKGDAEKTVSTWSVNLLTAEGIRAIPLDDIRSFNVTDKKIKADLAKALAAIAQSHDQSKKNVTVHFDGAGKRHVGAAYLIETPIWKATYRLMLPDPTSKDSAKIQAWAIVENQTDNDWNDIELSLVGGRPLGFIESLYQPLYNPRPVVQPQIAATLRPQTYDDGVGGAEAADASGTVTPPTFNLTDITKGGSTTGSSGGEESASLFRDTSGEKPAKQQNFVSNFNEGVAAIARSNKIGEMFHYKIEKVSIPRQQSSMIPIVTEKVTTERLSIYNPNVLSDRALRGVRLKNDTGKYLLGGPVTVMETAKDQTAYAGDARIDDVPPGQSRLLSYAVDQDMVANASAEPADLGIVGATVAKGTLHVRRINREVTDYTLQNKGDGDKSVIVEHPIEAGYEIKEPAKFLEKTDTVYRFAVPVAGKSTAKLKVVAEAPGVEEIAIMKLGDAETTVYLNDSRIPAAVKTMLQNVIAKRAAIADLDRKIKGRQEERSRILQEQANIRENIRVLPANSKGQQTAIEDLSAHDADLKKVTKDVQDLQKSAEAARADLDAYVADAVIE